jgi:RNA polymerase sigma factor (sigma-70 family)
MTEDNNDKTKDGEPSKGLNGKLIELLEEYRKLGAPAEKPKENVPSGVPSRKVPLSERLFEAERSRIFAEAMTLLMPTGYLIGKHRGQPDNAMIEEVLSDKILLLFEQYRENPQRFKPATILAWLRKTVIHQHIDEHRHDITRKHHITSIEDLGRTDKNGEPMLFDPPVHTDYAQDMVQKEDNDKVRRAVRSLPPEYRRAFILNEVKGYSYEEISEGLGVKKGTIRSRLHRAKGILRKELGGDAAQGASGRYGGSGSGQSQSSNTPGLYYDEAETRKILSRYKEFSGAVEERQKEIMDAVMNLTPTPQNILLTRLEDPDRTHEEIVGQFSLSSPAVITPNLNSGRKQLKISLPDCPLFLGNSKWVEGVSRAHSNGHGESPAVAIDR